MELFLHTLRRSFALFSRGNKFRFGIRLQDFNSVNNVFIKISTVLQNRSYNPLARCKEKYAQVDRTIIFKKKTANAAAATEIAPTVLSTVFFSL